MKNKSIFVLLLIIALCKNSFAQKYAIIGIKEPLIGNTSKMKPQIFITDTLGIQKVIDIPNEKTTGGTELKIESKIWELLQEYGKKGFMILSSTSGASNFQYFNQLNTRYILY